MSTLRAVEAFDDLGEFELAESDFCFVVELFPPAEALLKTGTPRGAYNLPEKEVPKAVTRALRDLQEGVKRVADGEPAPVVQQSLQPQITTIEEYAATAC